MAEDLIEEATCCAFREAIRHLQGGSESTWILCVHGKRKHIWAEQDGCMLRGLKRSMLRASRPSRSSWEYLSERPCEDHRCCDLLEV